MDLPQRASETEKGSERAEPEKEIVIRRQKAFDGFILVLSFFD
jgi:hypothetical protein